MSKDEVIRNLTDQNKKLTEQLSTQTLLIEKLQSQLDQLLRIMYGKKSEKKSIEINTEDSPPGNINPKNNKTISNSDTKSKPSRNKLPEHLEHKVIKYELSESERKCKLCKNICHVIGKEVSEQLEFIPAKLFVKEHRRYKYGCKLGCEVKIAPMPLQPIPKGIPGPNLLAEILISKYQDAMPLYRQLGKFKRHGIEIAESTLGSWVTQMAELLEPLVHLMKQDLLRSNKIHTDDTPVPVLSKGKTKQCRLWVYVADGSSSPACTVYDYSATRSKSVPQRFLDGYKGHLQADAFPGYDKLYESGDIVEIGCMAHTRRKFFDIAQAAKGESTASKSLEYIANIYKIDAKCREWHYLKRYYYRKKYLRPAYKKFYKWLVKTKKTLIGNTPIMGAFNYAINHWRALQNVFADGRLELDNNRAERAIKPIVIGRKNWLFAGSHQGGKSAAIMYSLIESAKQNNLNTFEYLGFVIANIRLTSDKDLYKLLPYFVNI